MHISPRPHTHATWRSGSVAFLAVRAIAGLILVAFALVRCAVASGETVLDAGEPPAISIAEPTAVAVTAPVVAPDTSTDEASPSEPDPESVTRGERTETQPDTNETADDAPVAVPEEIVEAPADDSGEIDDSEASETTETASFNQTDVASCMDGVWVSAPGQVGTYISRLAELTGASMTADGTLTVALDNGRYVYDASITTTIDVDGFVASSVLDGITQGSFEYTNGFIVAEQTFAEIDAYVEFPDGTRIDAGDLGEEFNQMAAFHEVPFDCDGSDMITLHFETLPGTARFPMTFQRQL